MFKIVASLLFAQLILAAPLNEDTSNRRARPAAARPPPPAADWSQLPDDVLGNVNDFMRPGAPRIPLSSDSMPSSNKGKKNPPFNPTPVSDDLNAPFPMDDAPITGPSTNRMPISSPADDDTFGAPLKGKKGNKTPYGSKIAPFSDDMNSDFPMDDAPSTSGPKAPKSSPIADDTFGAPLKGKKGKKPFGSYPDYPSDDMNNAFPTDSTDGAFGTLPKFGPTNNYGVFNQSPKLSNTRGQRVYSPPVDVTDDSFGGSPDTTSDDMARAWPMNDATSAPSATGLKGPKTSPSTDNTFSAPPKGKKYPSNNF